jgi:UDP-2-acetamido-2,6-beta-L-arabino-hexul-4-ose reductase
VTRILITGGRGFLGRNLAAHLRENKDCELTSIDREDSTANLHEALLKADIIFHLAGVNRPHNPVDFVTGNTEFTEQMCRVLHERGCSPKIVFSSSIQAEINNPYGTSKRKAETALRRFAADTGASVRIYRLKNLFGKWCRANYNSVTATFCHNIAHGLPIAVHDPRSELELSYVDDVVAAFLTEINGRNTGTDAGAELPSYRIRLGDLAGRIQAFHEMRHTIALPDFTGWFNRALYATYLSYVPSELREYGLNVRSDPRGSLAEFVKQKGMGQIFVSRTKPGVTRGNHYHHTKTEKFFVVGGNGLIRVRSIEGGPIDEYAVAGDRYQVIDIPPGFTHSITNVGTEELVTLFWSSEIFDPDRPDTYYLPVDFTMRCETVILESV